MARTYRRDSNGRFAGGGGTRSGRPAAKPVSRGRNRLTRDNAGKITSVGGQGATARGGRLRTAGGKLRATQTAKIKSSGGRLRKPVGGAQGAAASRTKKQAATAYKRRANKTAMKALRARTITESEKRIVVGRPKATQMNIWGRAEKVGAGKLRPIGERGRTGRIIKNKPDRTPGPGSPRAKRYRADALKAARELGAAGLFRDRGR
jgi:hypothetical protein